MDEQYAEAVLCVVEQIPPGRVMSYGAVADVVGAVLGRGGPRQVGQVMATGADVPWWRVVRADGTLPLSHDERAATEYLLEGTPRTPMGAINMREAAWAFDGVPPQDCRGPVEG